MKKTTNAICDTGRKESVQVALLQIHGGDGAYLSVLLGSLIGVSSVLPDVFSEIDQVFLYLSYSSEDGR